MIKAPNFWWKNSFGILGMLSQLIGSVYGFIAGKRMQREPTNVVNVPVICVGNFVVGGAGKTPFCIMLFKLLKDMGYSPVFLTRGYGGQQQDPVQVNRDHHTADQVGDEAILLASVGPTVVAKDRGMGAEYATTVGADFIIMDDGFQSPNLKKDLSIVLIDSNFGVGNGRCLPAGPLRAPLEVQISKTDLLVVVGSGENADEVLERASKAKIATVDADIKPLNTEQLSGLPILAYAGIGHPQKFFDSLINCGLNVVHGVGFADHHRYKNGEIKKLLKIAEQESLTLVTTAKDYARLAGLTGENVAMLQEQSKVFEVEMVLTDSESLRTMLKQMLVASKEI